jgi:hypothetical protein
MDAIHNLVIEISPLDTQGETQWKNELSITLPFMIKGIQ